MTDSVATFAGEGLATGAPVVLIATQAHLQAFRARLETMGFDVAAALAAGRLTCLDALEQLDTFMLDGVPDARLFEANLGEVMARSLKEARGTQARAYGEMVDVLWKHGERVAAILLEELWNELQTRHPFTLLCAYTLGSFYNEPAELGRICAAHTHVLNTTADGTTAEPSSMLAPYAHRIAKEMAEREEFATALRDALGQLQAREKALLKSEEQLRDFVENASIGLHRVGPDGSILWANRAELDMLGYAEHEYVGRPISQFHVDQSVIEDILRRLRAGETIHDCEARMRAKDGSTKHVVISSSVYAEDGRFVHTRCFTRDITEQRTLERYRQRAATRDAGLSKITAAIAQAVTREQVFEELVDQIHEAVGATSTALWLVHEDGRAAQLVRALGYSDAARQAVASMPLETERSTPAVDAMRTGEPVWIGSQAELLERYPHLGGIASPTLRYSICCLPLVAHGHVLGALGLTIESGREVDEEERSTLLLAARCASQAVERLRLFDAERRSRSEADAAAHRMGVLNNVSRVFVETDLELGPRLDAVVAELGTTLESAVGISLLKDDGLLHTCATYHPSPEAQTLLRQIGASAPIRVGDGVSGIVASTGRSLLLTDVNSAEALERVAPAYRAFLMRFPIYAMICAPLRSRGQVIGTLMATRTKEGETYTPDDVHLVDQLAERAAGAIENGRLYQETVDARLRAEQLYRFAATVVVASDIQTVFEAALDAIEAALGAKRASILTFDRAEVMRFVAWRNLSDEYRRAVEGHSPWRADATAPEAILVPDAKNDPAMAAYAPLFEREGIGALAFIPLIARRRLLGKFMVYYDERHPFAWQEVETARAIANHLASVIARFAAVSRLEETIRGNELFAGVLAHDLLNPLGAIVTGAQVLLMRSEGERAPDDRNSKPLSRILSSGQRMARMIHQLLDFTRARTGGGIEIQPRAGNLGELCADALGELELAHPEWRTRLESVGDVTGTWDGDRLVQVVSNLVANAGQHGRPGHEILVRVDGAAPDSVGIHVRNAGMVSPEVLPHLFDPFRTTRSGRDRSHGLGLGLFIVHELVRAHAGSVDVASERGSTTFRIRLPRHVPGSKNERRERAEHD